MQIRKGNRQFLFLCAQLTAAILVLPSAVNSQTAIHRAEEVAKAERNFAKKALQTSTKDAFIEFYADSVVVFRHGNAVRGNDWNSRKKDSSELWWQPVFADMASSGDFGYTTGPWEWKKSRNDGTVSAYGYYNSVWKKTDGVWRVVIDIGIPNNSVSPEKNKPTAFSSINTSPVAGNYSSLKKEVLAIEKGFSSAYREDNNAAYNKHVSGEVRIYRPYHAPYLSFDGVKKAMADTSLTFTFEPIDGDIAASGDMAYVYGNVQAKGTFNGQPVDARLNYMRIWKREKNKEWKIVLDVIGGQ